MHWTRGGTFRITAAKTAGLNGHRGVVSRHRRYNEPAPAPSRSASTAASPISLRFVAVSRVSRPSTVNSRSWANAGVLRIVKLGAITARELGVPGGIVVVPLSQLVRRRNRLAPLVEAGSLLAKTSRPEPVDEDPVSVVGLCRLVHPTNPRVHCPRHQGYQLLIALPLERRRPPGRCSCCTCVRSAFSNDRARSSSIVLTSAASVGRHQRPTQTPGTVADRRSPGLFRRPQRPFLSRQQPERGMSDGSP